MTKKLFPFFILFIFITLLSRSLFYAKPQELPSALIGEPVPNFKLPTFNQPNIFFSKQDLPKKVSLLNIWATWCYACSQEHEMLMKISKDYHIPINSIVYKDEEKNVDEWLNARGNPFNLIGNDLHGDAAIDFGIYGTPETFVISPQGRIVYRQVGAITQKTWDEVLYPIIKKYEA